LSNLTAPVATLMPPALKAGDTVTLLATARKINTDEIEFALQTLKSWGLNVTIGKTIGLDDNQFAGTDEERLGDLQEQLDDPNVKAIICARGGYGTLRLIDEIDFRKFIKKPKWICGFSDITVLHNHLLQVYNIASLHCTMPLNFEKNTVDSLESMKNALFGKRTHYKWNVNELNRDGNARGVICGGNLSLLYALSNSVSDVDTTDKILFIEDIDEYLYHIDRMMWQLKRAGKLENLAGLLVGHFTDMKDNTVPYGRNAYEIIAEAVSEYDYPVYFGFPAGHEADNRAIIIGSEVQLSRVDAEVSFRQLS
jgi:muramoyltetrapeptide carboxypeptidase